MKITLSHPTGNANVRAVAVQLAQSGMLNSFCTSIAAYPGNIYYSLGDFKLFREFHRRRYNPILQSYTHSYPWLEIGRALASKMKWDSLLIHETGLFCIDQIYQSVDKHVAQNIVIAQKHGLEAVYAYEDGALDTFKRAKELGLKCIYDLPIAYWETGRKLMVEDANRFPQWAFTLGGGIKDSVDKLARKRNELELADVVVCPGSFVMDSLPVWAKQKKLIVSPFGSPIISNPLADSIRQKTDKNRPLRVLFAGSMGQRKGLADLFAAMRILNHPNIELVVMGSLLAPMEFYRGEYAHFTYEQGRPHEQVLALMRSCDVLCLPSIVEGRALVMQEAMSQGLPIIITPNTGGEDLIEEGKTGFLVPIRDAQAIAEKLNWFEENRYLIPEMALNAQNKAKTFTWENYGKTIANELTSYLNHAII